MQEEMIDGRFFVCGEDVFEELSILESDGFFVDVAEAVVCVDEEIEEDLFFDAAADEVGAEEEADPFEAGAAGVGHFQIVVGGGEEDVATIGAFVGDGVVGFADDEEVADGNLVEEEAETVER